MKIQKTFLRSVQVFGLAAVICLGSCTKPAPAPSGPFNNIIINGSCNVTFAPGSTNKVSSNTPFSVVTAFSNNTLTLSGAGKATIEVSDLDHLTINGTSTVTNSVALNLKHPVIACNGSDSILLTLNIADSVSILTAGTGKYHFSGTTPKLNVTENGSALFHGYNLTSQNCTATVNGMNRTEVYVTNNLTVYMNGAGDVYYKGNPVSVTPIVNNGTGQLIPQ